VNKKRPPKVCGGGSQVDVLGRKKSTAFADQGSGVKTEVRTTKNFQSQKMVIVCIEGAYPVKRNWIKRASIKNVKRRMKNL